MAVKIATRTYVQRRLEQKRLRHVKYLHEFRPNMAFKAAWKMDSRFWVKGRWILEKWMPFGWFIMRMCAIHNRSKRWTDTGMDGFYPPWLREDDDRALDKRIRKFVLSDHYTYSAWHSFRRRRQDWDEWDFMADVTLLRRYVDHASEADICDTLKDRASEIAVSLTVFKTWRDRLYSRVRQLGYLKNDKKAYKSRKISVQKASEREEGIESTGNYWEVEL